MSTTTEYRELVNKYLPRPIRTEAEYRRALRQVENLMEPHPRPARHADRSVVYACRAIRIT